MLVNIANCIARQDAFAWAKPESIAKAEAEAEPESITKAKAEADAVSIAKTKAEAKAEAETEAETEADAVSIAKAKAEAKAEAKPESIAKTKAEAKPESIAKAKVNAQPKAIAIAEPSAYLQCGNARYKGEYCHLHYHDDSDTVRIDDVFDIDIINNLINKLTQIKKVQLFNYDKYPQYDFSDKTFEELQSIVSGPAYENPLLSHNNTDPISQEEIWNSNSKQLALKFDTKFLFSYCDENGFIQCFNIMSIQQLFKQNIYYHPITQIKFSQQTIDYANIKMEILNITDDNKLSEISVFDVFQQFHKFNMYPKDEWFLNLSLPELRKMYCETHAFYIKNIYDNGLHTKLVPPNGIAFDIPPKDINKYDKTKLRTILLTNINKIVSSCEMESLQILGIYVALGGLITVSKEARSSYPNITFAFDF